MDGASGPRLGETPSANAVARVWAKAREPPAALHLTLNAVIDASGSEPSVERVMSMVTSGDLTQPVNGRAQPSPPAAAPRL